MTALCALHKGEGGGGDVIYNKTNPSRLAVLPVSCVVLPDWDNLDLTWWEDETELSLGPERLLLAPGSGGAEPAEPGVPLFLDIDKNIICFRTRTNLHAWFAISAMTSAILPVLLPWLKTTFNSTLQSCHTSNKITMLCKFVGGLFDN